MLTVLNPDGRGSRAHAPEAIHTLGLKFTGGDNATHTRVSGRNLLGPCALAEDFFSWESGCICIFFSSRWLPRQRVRACVCVYVYVCVCVCEREREREKERLNTSWQAPHLNCGDFATSPHTWEMQVLGLDHSSVFLVGLPDCH